MRASCRAWGSRPPSLKASTRALSGARAGGRAPGGAEAQEGAGGAGDHLQALQEVALRRRRGRARGRRGWRRRGSAPGAPVRPGAPPPAGSGPGRGPPGCAGRGAGGLRETTRRRGRAAVASRPRCQRWSSTCTSRALRRQGHHLQAPLRLDEHGAPVFAQVVLQQDGALDPGAGAVGLPAGGGEPMPSRSWAWRVRRSRMRAMRFSRSRIAPSSDSASARPEIGLRLA